MSVIRKETRDRQGRPAVKYVARWMDADNRQKEKSFARKSEAERFEREVKASKDRGLYLDPKAGRVTVAAFLNDLLERLPVVDTTLDSYRISRDKHILPALGGFRLVDLRATHIQAWLKVLQRDLAPATVKRHYGVFAGWMKRAVEEGLISKSPCTGIKLGTPPRKQIKPFTVDQVRRIVENTPDHYKAAVILAASSGLRQGEVLALTVSDIGFLKRRVSVQSQVVSGPGRRAAVVRRTKTRSSNRVVPLPTATIDALARHIELFPPADDQAPIFTNKSGGITRKGTFNSMWKRILRRAGIPCGDRENTFHGLRHFYASTLMALRGGA